MREYRIVKGSIEEITEKIESGATNCDTEEVFKSQDADEIVEKLDEIGATDETHGVEIYDADGDGGFLNGMDYDNPENFKKRVAEGTL